MFLKKIEYKPLYAGEERPHHKGLVGGMAGRTGDILLFDNPDRGYRTTVPLIINPLHMDPEDPTKPCPHCDLIIREADGTVRYNSKSKCSGKHDVRHTFGNLDRETNEKVLDYMFDLIYMKHAKTDYAPKLMLLQACFYKCNKDEKLPDYIGEILNIYFDKCRKYGVRVLFRHGYHGVQFNWNMKDEWREMHEKVGASEEVMIAHAKQLAPIITKNLDIIHKMSSGFIGSGGEQAYNYQYPVVDYDRVIKTIVEEICVPNGLYYTVRMPRYKQNLLARDPDYKYAKIIGHNNDAMFGESRNYGWASECYQFDHNFETEENDGKCFESDNEGEHKPNDMWEYVTATGAYTPQSGEMFHFSGTTGTGRVPSGFHLIKQCAHHRFNTMSQWNSYIECGYAKEEKDEQGRDVAAPSPMQDWIDFETVIPGWLNEEKIPFDPSWFVKENGERVVRNPYEFIRDHLGYKLQAQSLEIERNQVTLTLKNFGFAAPFCLESGFAVLDEDYNMVAEVKAGNPDEWISVPVDYYVKRQFRSVQESILTHSVSAILPIPNDGKKYYIAFYLRNRINQCARLSNSPDSIDFKNGYNILCEIN